MDKILFNNIEGIAVGHAESEEGITGCSVVLCHDGATGGVDVRGGAPGTREIALLDSTNLVDKVHAIFLSGGSAFGLDVGTGIMKYLEERNIGFDVKVTRVPIVCGAVLFDLNIGNPKVRPNAEMGYNACLNSNNVMKLSGNVGAGKGATVGKILGTERSMKGGLGTYALQIGDLQVGAMVAVNCLGDVIDPNTGEVIAGVLNKEKNCILSTEEILVKNYDNNKNVFNGNTTIGIIATNGIFDKAQANKIASMAHNGYGRTMRPAHTMFDGDTIFTVATGKVKADINVVGMLSAHVMERAIIEAIKGAEAISNYKCYRDIIE
ncbi:P1 family peptidase [Clostridiisalibacter paucivorans]|uniref:P1 family peptidase n=1 Tax=Clostridiisalibacter paucivorans TaxID=408753 RepID=UPI00047AA0AF|nr:P1 family peptidase [Clostridiisalibacter paucivorans]